MLEGAFSFRGRVGRLNYFLAGLLMVPAVVVAVLVFAVLMAGAQRSVASLVFFAIVGVLMIGVAFWYGLSLHVRRIRDIGWDPFVVIVGSLAVYAVDAVVAAKVPALAIGHGTAFGVTFKIALSLALLFWPGRDHDDIVAVFDGELDAEPRPSRLAALGLGTPARLGPLPGAAPMRAAVRKEFGRRGAR